MKITQLFLAMILPVMAYCQSEPQTDPNMTHLLKNKLLEIQIDMPLANYHSSRFDWTGKIKSVKYKNVYVSGIEKINTEDSTNYGKGFYNEFGIDRPVGFDEAKEGDYFHKIGIGLLKKEGEEYQFFKKYEVIPAEFAVDAGPNKLTITCTSQNMNGYAYVLKKEIELLNSGFMIRYRLHNTGEKTIQTDEYVHNFLAINKELIDSNYILRYPFRLRPERFTAVVNPENLVEIGDSAVRFKGTPTQQFFYSNVTGNDTVAAAWELVNLKSRIGIRLQGSFTTAKSNLWGWKQVVSPEMFFDIDLPPGESVEWSRTYEVFEE